MSCPHCGDPISHPDTLGCPDLFQSTMATPLPTPNPELPPFVIAGPRRKMLITIEVGADFEKRLDNQWEVEREINADRWSWRWADTPQ